MTDIIMNKTIGAATGYGYEVLNKTEKEFLVVQEILEKFDEFGFLPSIVKDRIFVVKNTKRKVSEEDLESGKINPVNIYKIPPKFAALIDPEDQFKFPMYMIEIIEEAFTGAKYDSNQYKAFVYFTLRKIKFNGNLGDNNSNDWIKILHGLGKEFNNPHHTCTDILSPDFSWEKSMREYYQLIDRFVEENDYHDKG